MNRAERLEADGVQGDPILFYSHTGPLGIFSNFSPHPVDMFDPFTGEMRTYPTTEHRFQAMKAPSAHAHRAIAEAATAGKAKFLGGPRSPIPGMVLREGWGGDYGDLCYYVMFEAVLCKAIQHPAMAAHLRRTKGKHIYEDSPTDDIWGWRFENDHRGKNLLGRVLMDVRHLV